MKKDFRVTSLVLLLILSCAGEDRKDDPKLRLKYMNMKYMFSLQLPEKWINYMDFEKIEIIDPQIAVPAVYFALPTKSREWQPLNVPDGYADLFYIRIFTRAEWKLFEEKYKWSDEFKLSDKLPGEGKEFVYMIRYSDSIPVDLYLYMKESGTVTDTFRILKKN